jgi:protein TonB
MIWIAIAAAAQIGAPVPPVADVRMIFTADDYPPTALQRNEQGAVLPEINPDGRVESCTIASSSGFPDLDSTTCLIIRRRAHFAAPKGPSGEPVYSLNRTVVSWSLGQPFKAILNPDMELSINRAPDGIHLPVALSIRFLREADGSVTSCQASEPAPAELVALACQATGASNRRIIRNVAKLPVRALDSATVRFVLDKG